jgi:hypothetical protein
VAVGGAVLAHRAAGQLRPQQGRDVRQSRVLYACQINYIYVIFMVFVACLRMETGKRNKDFCKQKYLPKR